MRVRNTRGETNEIELTIRVLAYYFTALVPFQACKLASTGAGCKTCMQLAWPPEQFISTEEPVTNMAVTTTASTRAPWDDPRFERMGQKQEKRGKIFRVGIFL